METSIAADRRARKAPDTLARISAYGANAVDRECAAVEAAGQGSRNARFNEAAFTIGRLVGAGALPEGPTLERLTAAGAAAGLNPTEIRTTLRSGFERGKAQPRDLDNLPDRRTWRSAIRRPAPRPTAKPAPVTAPKRPPQAEVLALWESSLAPGLTMAEPPPGYLDGCGYLAARNLPSYALSSLDMVRILPAEYPWPAWWLWGNHRRWTVAVLGYEADGTPASLHARAVDFPGWPLPEGAPKTIWPKGYESRGLLFADRRGLALLRGEGEPLAGVLLAEGLTDTLALALYAARKSEAFAVLGLAAGGASALARVVWPEGLTAFVCTDSDEAGERYADEAAAALPASVSVLRVRL